MKKKIFNKHIFRLVIFLIIYSSLCLYIYDSSIRNREIIVNNYDVEPICELQNGDVIEQKIDLLTRSINKIVLYPASYGNSKAGHGNLYITICDENGDQLCYKKIKMSDITDNMELTIDLDRKIFRTDTSAINVILKVEGQSNSDKFTLYAGTGQEYNTVYNGNEMNKALKIGMITHAVDYFSIVCLISAVLIGFLIIIVYVFLFIKSKKSIHYLFIPIAIIFGIIYFAFFPEYMTPDELRHIETAYYFSNQVLGESEDDYVCFRKNDYEHLYDDDGDETNIIFRKTFNRENYNTYYYNLLNNDDDASNIIIESDIKPLEAKRYLYLFSGLGILIGRCLSLNSAWTLLLGAFLNYLVCALGIFYALKKIPIMKEAMLLIAIMPITMQQITSYSYDSIIIVLAFVFISLCLKLTLGMEKKSELLLLTISAILLIQVKSGIYCFIIGLIIIPIVMNYKRDKKFSRVLMGIFIMAILVLAINYIGGVAGQNISNMSSNNTVSWAEADGYTISYLLNHLDKVPVIIWDTILNKGSDYFYTTFSGGLSWFTINMPWWMVILFFMCILFAAFKEEDNIVCDLKWKRAVVIIIPMICFAAICGSMLLAWTPIYMTAVEGVQGRYFIPFLPLLFLGIKTNGVTVKTRIVYSAILTSIVLQIFVFRTLLVSI